MAPSVWLLSMVSPKESLLILWASMALLTISRTSPVNPSAVTPAFSKVLSAVSKACFSTWTTALI